MMSPRRQVTSADKKFPNGEFAAGLQTEYIYDMAGNRTSKSQGGTGGGTTAPYSEGIAMRTTTYGAANALNQYPSVAHPNTSGTYYADVSGRRSSSTETIKVNNVVAGYQQNTSTGRHFRREVPLTGADLSSGYAYLFTTSTATVLDAGYQYIPFNQVGTGNEPLTYDADGNLLTDGRWTYRWDAENRLASLQSSGFDSQSQTANYTRLAFRYDGLSRRISTIVEKFDTETYYWWLDRRTSCVYDGWNLVREKTEDWHWEEGLVNTTSANYIWGPDIGSSSNGHTSWQKAGGVGGLLFVNGNSAPHGKQFPLMDRLGNVTGYRRAITGSPAALDAVYEYDPFGREIRSTGPASDLMPYRFSTKYTDAETGLVYYGYRFYDPDRGRWVNRDPIGERGGVMLYNFVNNSPPNLIDYLGQTWFGTLAKWLGVGSACVGGLVVLAGGAIGPVLVISGAIWLGAAALDNWIDPDDGNFGDPGPFF